MNPVSTQIGFIILGLIVIISYLIYRKIQSNKNNQFIRKFGAPDYKTALEIKNSGFSNFKTYNDARKKGAKTVDQFELVNKFGIDDYAIAEKISRGGFANYEQYKRAKEDGFGNFQHWRMKEYRKEILIKLMNKAESISKEDFMIAMEFEDSRIFMEWILNLPEDSPLRLKGELIIFSRIEMLSKPEQNASIDQLVQTINKDKTCYYCGAILAPNENFCTHCGNKILICYICNGAILFGDETGACVYCQHEFHYTHLAEWVKVKGKCTLCHKSIIEDDIIRKQLNKAKKK